MNPFQLTSTRRPLADLEPPDEVEGAVRTMRLMDDLRALAAGLDRAAWASVSIVKSPDRLEVATYDRDDHVTPLLAASLLADIEQTLAAGELVKGRLPPEWRNRLLGTPA